MYPRFSREASESLNSWVSFVDDKKDSIFTLESEEYFFKFSNNFLSIKSSFRNTRHGGACISSIGDVEGKDKERTGVKKHGQSGVHRV